MEIRKATKRDKETISRVHAASIKALCSRSYSRGQVNAWIGVLVPSVYDHALTEKVFLVADDSRQGVLGLGMLDVENGEISALYIDPDAAGKGVGTKLLRELEIVARKSNIRNITVHSTLNAKGFYKGHGYEEQGMAFHDLPDGSKLECVRMIKDMERQVGQMELEIEKVSLNAWPAPESIEYGHWVLRFANGYTKRANSATVLGDAKFDIEGKIRYCESRYKRRKLKSIFRLPSFIDPGVLDKALEEKGYRLEDPTLVMQKKLVRKTVRGADPSEEKIGSWLKIFNQFTDANPDNEEKHLAILNAISSKKLFAVHGVSGKTVSCGLGVLENDYFGIFDLATDPEQQRKGYATTLLSGMLDWAMDNGAKTAYLQVTRTNARALSLYKRLGFAKLYKYWYRVKQV